MKPIEKLATNLHERFCAHSHVNVCGWHYEYNNWEASAHERWLSIAIGFVEKNKAILIELLQA
jgi:hypothetical protein